MIDTRHQPCPNCPCCEATIFCDGCWETLCLQCWAEHNEDAPCHSCDPEEHEDFAFGEGVDEEEAPRVRVFLIPCEALTAQGEQPHPSSFPFSLS